MQQLASIRVYIPLSAVTNRQPRKDPISSYDLLVIKYIISQQVRVH